MEREGFWHDIRVNLRWMKRSANIPVNFLVALTLSSTFSGLTEAYHRSLSTRTLELPVNKGRTPKDANVTTEAVSGSETKHYVMLIQMEINAICTKLEVPARAQFLAIPKLHD
jgi:hypothetical protein